MATEISSPHSASAPGHSTGFSWKLVVLFIVLAILGTGAWIYYRLETWPQRTAREVSRAFAEIAQIQPKITVHDQVFFEQTSPVLELAVVSRETTVEREMEHDWLGSKKHIRIRATYNVRAGFNLQESFTVNVDDHRILVEVPPPRILAIDPGNVDVLQLENGYWNKITPGDLEIEMRALPAIARQKAEQTGLTKEAVDTFTKRLRDQLGNRYEIEVRTAKPAAEPLP